MHALRPSAFPLRCFTLGVIVSSMLRRRILVAGLLCGASPAAVAQPASLTLGTTPDGGGFSPYAVALIETLKSIDRGLDLRTVDTRGSTDNVVRLRAGSIDLGLVSGEVFDESETRAPGRLKIVSVMYYTPGMFAVLGNSPHRTISIWSASRSSGSRAAPAARCRRAM